MRILAALITAALVLAAPVAAHAGNAEIRSLVALDTTVSTGAPNAPQETVLGNKQAMIYIKTANEVATASLTVQVLGLATDGQGVTLCTIGPITTETSHWAWIGEHATATPADVDTACAVPLTKNLGFIYTVTGAGASFDVTTDLLLVAE